MLQPGSIPGYRMTGAGLFYEREPREAKPDDKSAKPIWLSPPFEIMARSRDADGPAGAKSCGGRTATVKR